MDVVELEARTLPDEPAQNPSSTESRSWEPIAHGRTDSGLRTILQPDVVLIGIIPWYGSLRAKGINPLAYQENRSSVELKLLKNLFWTGNASPPERFDGEPGLRRFLDKRDFRLALWLTNIALHLEGEQVVGITGHRGWETGFTTFAAPLLFGRRWSPPPMSFLRRLPLVGDHDWLIWADGPRIGIGGRPASTEQLPRPLAAENGYLVPHGHYVKIEEELDERGRLMMGYYAPWVHIRIEYAMFADRAPLLRVVSTGVPSRCLYLGPHPANATNRGHCSLMDSYRMEGCDRATLDGFMYASTDYCGLAPIAADYVLDPTSLQ